MADRGGRGDLLQQVRGNPSPSGHFAQSVPTPTAGDSKSARNSTARRHTTPPTGVHAGDTLTDFVTKWPTPNARDWKDAGPSQGARKSPNLGTVVHWPTPHGMPQPGATRKPGPSGNELGRAVNEAERTTLPTPTSSRRTGLQSHGVNVVTGSLNPTWVEVLMGYPRGWTEIGSGVSHGSRRESR